MTRFGPLWGQGGATFRLWGPQAAGVSLLRPDAEPQPMHAAGEGFFELFVEGARPGQRYMFGVDEAAFPDPAGRAQEKDADGWSLLCPPPSPPRRSHALRPWHEAVIAEIHVGAATPEGTFAALAGRLDHFRRAGFTAIELMPVTEFMGARNWGYDGVLPFAPDTSYGRPEDLRALVDAAHDQGLGVLIDVVYNHFGPAGNFLHRYAGDFFTDSHVTPWGPAIALDHPTVRAFFCENLAMWLQDYDVDGLRFDAVHAFLPAAAETFLAELATCARAIKPDAWLVLENDHNLARWLQRDDQGRPTLFTAQWNDDDHHALRVLTTGDNSAHFADYGEDPVGSVQLALAEGFIYQGEVSPYRGLARGEPSGDLPPEAFVTYVQNHDQIGNRPLGDRLVSLLTPEKPALLRFILMLAPQIPMFFMGEEVGFDTPFPFFCDFEGNLAEAVRSGRRAEFAPFFENHRGSVDDLPDPLAIATFLKAKLPWQDLPKPGHKDSLETFRRLAELRRELVWPLAASGFRGSSSERSGEAIETVWRFGAGVLSMALNLGAAAGSIAAPPGPPAAALGIVNRDRGAVVLEPWSGAVWVQRL